MSAVPFILRDPLRDLRHRKARSAPAVAAWLTWLDLGGKTSGTLEQYEWTLAALLRMFPEHAPADFTEDELGMFLLGFPKKSRANRWVHLNQFFKFARTSKRIDANPMDLVPRAKRQPHNVPDTFTDSERAAMCALPLPDGPLMRLLLEGGLRKAEARNITGKRIDFERGCVIVKEGAKGSKDRTVPMMPALATALDELLTVEGIGRDDFLWYDRPGGGRAFRVRRSKPVGNPSFDRWWARSLEKAGVRYRNPHTTRHTYAGWLKSEFNLPIEDISRSLGHSSIATTVDIYMHLTTVDIGVRMLAKLTAKD